MSYCAVCDGAFFKGETIAVVGGGDAAVEEADYLTRYAEKVYLVHRRDEFRASKILQERLFANPKIEVIWNKRVLELFGDPSGLKTIELEDTVTGQLSTLTATGCFVFIGFRPNTGHRAGSTSRTMPAGYMITDDRMMTSIPGLFAAGDLRVQLTRQVTTAVGDATTAAIAVEKYLTERRQPRSRSAREPMPVSELVVRKFPNGQFAQNCYLVGDAATRAAVLIDPGEEPGDVPRRARHPAAGARGHLAHPRARGSHHGRAAGAGGHRRRRSTCTPTDRPLYATCPSRRRGWASSSRRCPPPDGELPMARSCGWAAPSSWCATRRGIRRAA